LGLDCKNALVVGFGIGVTTAAIGVHKDVENIDCIELVKSLTDVAHFYTEINNNIHNDSRLRFYEDDGRHFMQTTDKKYDLISSDPTHPILGSGSLYTYEYFKLCRSRLTENGMVSQYLPLHKLSLSDFLGLIKTFHSVFPNSTVWLGHYHAILIGSMKPIDIDFGIWSNNMQKTSDDKLFLNNPYYLAANLVLDAVAIEKITADYKINTDNIAYTDYFSFNSLRDDNIAINLDFLNDNRDGMWRVFNNVTDTVQMQRFIKGNQYFTKGLVYMFYDDWKQLFQYIEKACMVNPENIEYPLMLEFYSRAEKFNVR
jgi:spermidine synthase